MPAVQVTIAQQIRTRWGNELRMERHRRRLTQPQVAERAGVAQSNVSAAEQGRGSFEAITKIAAALNVVLSTEQTDDEAAS